MQWYEKFKVGQKVNVVKRIDSWLGASWVKKMDGTINKTYEILDIDEYIGYLLSTTNDVGRTFWYSVESLAYVKGQQLLFDFME